MFVCVFRVGDRFGVPSCRVCMLSFLRLPVSDQVHMFAEEIEDITQK